MILRVLNVTADHNLSNIPNQLSKLFNCQSLVSRDGISVTPPMNGIHSTASTLHSIYSLGLPYCLHCDGEKMTIFICYISYKLTNNVPYKRKLEDASDLNFEMKCKVHKFKNQQTTPQAKGKTTCQLSAVKAHETGKNPTMIQPPKMFALARHHNAERCRSWRQRCKSSGGGGADYFILWTMTALSSFASANDNVSSVSSAFGKVVISTKFAVAYCGRESTMNCLMLAT